MNAGEQIKKGDGWRVTGVPRHSSLVTITAGRAKRDLVEDENDDEDN
jgi:hypothetical protein